MSEFLIETFVTTKAGEPFRLFPFGRIVKNGIVRELTRALAERFRLPHFKPPIKLGSHADETPAGGHIVGLEVREDGLYAVPEYTDAGASALAAGNYRYHSPEIIWDGFIEDSLTGERIAGPLIVGTALLHMPALGEAAALYGAVAVDTKGESNMTENTVTVPTSWFDRLLSREPEPTPQSPQPSDDFAAKLEAQRADFEAKIAEYEAQLSARQAELAELQAQAAHGARVDRFAAELAETAVSQDAELAELLAGLADEQAALIVQRLRALSAQIDASALTTDVGAAGGGDADPYSRFDVLVKEHMSEFKTDYNAAVAAVAKRHPQLAQEVTHV